MTDTLHDSKAKALVIPYKEGMTAVITKNKLYLLGGVLDSATSTDTVYSISVDKNKKLSNWTVQESLPVTTYKTQALVTKTRVYLFGGYMNDKASCDVYTASIHKDGTLGTWTPSSPLPAKVSASHAVVANDKIYLVQTQKKATYHSSVYSASIHKDGTIGTWAVDTTPKQ